MTYLVAYAIGGPGTCTKPGFLHLACGPTFPYQAATGETITDWDTYKRVIPLADAEALTCRRCTAPLRGLP
jgi:hypothetical protein